MALEESHMAEFPTETVSHAEGMGKEIIMKRKIYVTEGGADGKENQQ